MSEIIDKKPKKELIIHMLNILREHTDRKHTLSQNEIKALVEKETGMTINRKTVRSNLSKLMELGFPIKYREFKNERINKYGVEETILTDWYYDHEFTAGELKFLIYGTMFSNVLPKKDKEQLIKKLEKQSNKFFRSSNTALCRKTENPDVLKNTEILDNAVLNGKQAEFNYCFCGTDMKLHFEKDENNRKRIYRVNPYQIVNSGGYMYLICSLDEKNELIHFRLDRIKNAELTDVPVIPLRMIKGFETGMRFSEYIEKHPDMCGGKVRNVVLRCGKEMTDTIADIFGANARIELSSDGMMTVFVSASEEFMLRFALKYADKAEITVPDTLRKEIAVILEDSLRKYKQN